MYKLKRYENSNVFKILILSKNVCGSKILLQTHKRKFEAIREMEKLFFGGIFNYIGIEDKNGVLVTERKRKVMYNH